MSKLSETYAQVQNQLQYGPGLAPFFEALVAQVDANTAAIRDAGEGLQDGVDLILSETSQEVKDATAREDIGVLVDQVAALTEQVKELQQTIAIPTTHWPKTDPEPAPDAEQVAAPSAITPPPSVSTAQPDPSGAAPNSTTGAE